MSDELVDQIAQAGDKLAEMLGYTVAAIESGEGFSPAQFESARRGIAIWHRLKVVAGVE